jgi:colicin import membrane protein
MKEWRQAQTTQAAPVAVAVPEAVQQANTAAVAALWLNATELANQSLRSAQAAWDKERGELDDMRAELANSFEVQAAEFETTKKQLAESEAKTAELAQELDAVRQREVEAINRAEVAEARITEIEHRAADLRGELDRALAETERQRAELAEARAKASVEIEAAHAATEAARAELVKVQAKADAREEAHVEQGKQAQAEIKRAVERMAKTEAERDTARKEAGEAREAAARLTGKLEAVTSQNAELLAVIKPPIAKVEK